MNYCIKMISTNKLYEAELDLIEPDGPETEKNETVNGSPRKRR
jgi:hypothetical protein